MLKTKFQDYIFTLMMVIFMAYSMIVYNIAINSSTGLVNQTFLIALKEFSLESIIVLILAYFFASPIAKKLAFRIVNPDKDNKMFIILSIPNFYSLSYGRLNGHICFVYSTFNTQYYSNYIVLYCKNFIMAYPLQIFFVGPLVRNIFRVIFKKKLQQT